MSDDPELNPGDEAPPDAPNAGETVCPDCGGEGCETCGDTGLVTEAVGGG